MRVAELSNDFRAVIRWAETPCSGSHLRRIEIIPGDINDYWELLSALEGWQSEFSDDVAAPFVKLRLCESRMQAVHPFPYVNTDAIIVDTFDEAQTQKVVDCLDSMNSEMGQIQLLYVSMILLVRLATENGFG